MHICTSSYFNINNGCENLLNFQKVLNLGSYSLHKVISLFKNCIDSIKNIMYKQSVFFAANSEAILKEQNKYKDLSWLGKVKVGSIYGVSRAVAILFIPIVILFSVGGVSNFNTKFNRNELIKLIQEIILCGVVCPIIEELLFRGIIQRIFQSIPFLSPAKQVIASSFIFSAIHLINGGIGSVVQAFRIFLFPSHDILYKTTSSITAPMICHMSYNTVCVILINLIKKSSAL